MEALKQCFTDAIASGDCKAFLALCALHRVNASWQAVCHDTKPSLRVVDGFAHVILPANWVGGDEHDGWRKSGGQLIAGSRQVFKLQDLRRLTTHDVRKSTSITKVTDTQVVFGDDTTGAVTDPVSLDECFALIKEQSLWRDLGAPSAQAYFDWVESLGVGE